MLEYGAQEELESLENTLINLLSTLPYLLKDTINNKEMDSKTLQEIKAQIKQAQIDILNKAKTNLSKSDDFMDICSWHIDKIIEEIEK